MYFGQILDATIFLQSAFISAAFCLFCLPKKFEKTHILFIALMFVGSYIVCVFVPAVVFALTANIPFEFGWRSLFYSLSIPFIVLIFALIFSKGRRLHRFVKGEILLASILIVGVLSKNIGFFAGFVAGDEPVWLEIARSFPYLLFTAIALMLNRIDISRYRHLSKEMVAIVTILSFVLIAVGVQEHYAEYYEKDTNLILSLLDVALLLLLAFSYYATYKDIENRHRITLLEVQNTLREADLEAVKINEVNREELAKMRHDLRNHASYILLLTQQKKYDELEKYIEEYIEKNKGALNSFSSSNSVINSIINLEIAKAKIEGIKMNVSVVVPPRLPFDDGDLVSLLTNVIDNAIENYDKESKKNIEVKILKQNDFIRFLVTNPIHPNRSKSINVRKTSKLGRGHGYGVKIVRSIVQRWGGYVDFSVEGDLFVCDAVLSLEAKGGQNV